MKKFSRFLPFLFLMALLPVMAAAIFYFSREGRLLQAASLKAPKKTQTVSVTPSLFRMLPFVSRQDSRKAICAFKAKANASIKKLCRFKYNNLKRKDTKKIEELFSVLNRIKKEKNASVSKYVTAMLVFSTLPDDSDTSEPLSFLLNAIPLAEAAPSAPRTGMTRAQYEKRLADDFAAVKKNCPQPGYENWILTTMCSEHSWVNGVAQPIYSKQYAEFGGPCASEAGAIESYRTNSIINTRMKSESNFTDSTNTSHQIACSFSCGSFKCPAHEASEAARQQCENIVYYPHDGNKYKLPSKIPRREVELALEEAQRDCEDRGYDYQKNDDGTTERVKARDCFLESMDADFEQKRQPPNYKPVWVQSYCCSCSRPDRGTYVSVDDFSQEGADSDLLQRILDAFRDSPPMTPPVQDAVILPPVDSPSTPPVQDTVTVSPVTPPVQDTVTVPPITPPVQDIVISPPVSPVSPTPSVTPTPTPQPTQPTPEPQAQLVRFRVACSVTKTRLADGYMTTRLEGKVEQVDANGNPTPRLPAAIYGGGLAGRGAICTSLTNKAPKCVDPRTNNDADPIDFIKEYDLNQTPIAQINQELDGWFWAMNGDRNCTAEELPIQ